jgi:hypothetical protein
MAVVGRKQMTYPERVKLFRNTPNDVRVYSTGVSSEHGALIESFTRTDYQLYERLMHAYKRVDPMLHYCQVRNVQGPVNTLALIRKQDLLLHQKLLQVLRHRWTSIAQVQKDAVNMDTDKFWFKMAGAIQRRCQLDAYELDPTWTDRAVLIDWLKTQYSKQEGLCAVSGEPLELTIGARATNGRKCSPDRQDSNKGYEPSNVWLVCWWVNQMKLDMPMTTFWKRIDILARQRSA